MIDLYTLCPKCLEEGEVTLGLVERKENGTYEVTCQIHDTFWFLGDPRQLCVGNVRNAALKALKNNAKLTFWLHFLKAAHIVKMAYKKVMAG